MLPTPAWLTTTSAAWILATMSSKGRNADPERARGWARRAVLDLQLLDGKRGQRLHHPIEAEVTAATGGEDHTRLPTYCARLRFRLSRH